MERGVKEHWANATQPMQEAIDGAQTEGESVAQPSKTFSTEISVPP